MKTNQKLMKCNIPIYNQVKETGVLKESPWKLKCSNSPVGILFNMIFEATIHLLTMAI